MSRRSSSTSLNSATDNLALEEEQSRRREETRSSCSSSRIEELANRVDEYLSVTRLGRQAFAEGDLKLAKDRFSLSMDIELHTDLECICDSTVGRATGELRHELQTRFNGSPQLLAGARRRDRYSKVLGNLEQLFLKAEQKITSSPSDPQSYLLMASALIVVNEWSKAKSVYKEGIANCPDNTAELERGLERLNKVESVTMLFQLGDKTKSRRRRLFSKKQRPSSALLISEDALPRSFSFDEPDTLNSPKSSPPSSPGHSPVPPRKSLNAGRIAALASPMTHRKNSFVNFLTMKKKRHPASPLVAKRQSLNHVSSWSMEDLAAVGTSGVGEKSEWRALFNPNICSHSLDDGLSTQSVQFLRLLGTMDSDSLKGATQEVPTFSLHYATEYSSSEESVEF